METRHWAATGWRRTRSSREELARGASLRCASEERGERWGTGAGPRWTELAGSCAVDEVGREASGARRRAWVGLVLKTRGDLGGDGFGSGGDPDVGEEWRRGGTSLLGFRVRLDLVGGGL